MNPIEFRRHLHRYPERSFEEYRTAAFIGEQLTALGIPHRPIARTGILATITGRRTPEEAPTPAQETETATATAGPAALPPSASPLKPSADRPSAAPAAAPPRRAVVLRADIDALPIEECTGLPYASEHPGVMHACGHDLHAAVLYGVLQRLAADPDFDGTVLGLFQPGEECNPGGASLVLAEEPFAGYDVAAVIGEHCEWQLPVGTLGFRAGKYMASSDELRFDVVGRGGHGAQRATLVDPVAAAATLVTTPPNASSRSAASKPTGRRTSSPTTSASKGRCAPSTRPTAGRPTPASPPKPPRSTPSTPPAPPSRSATATPAS